MSQPSLEDGFNNVAKEATGNEDAKTNMQIVSDAVDTAFEGTEQADVSGNAEKLGSTLGKDFTAITKNAPPAAAGVVKDVTGNIKGEELTASVPGMDGGQKGDSTGEAQSNPALQGAQLPLMGQAESGGGLPGGLGGEMKPSMDPMQGMSPTSPDKLMPKPKPKGP